MGDAGEGEGDEEGLDDGDGEALAKHEFTNCSTFVSSPPGTKALMQASGGTTRPLQVGGQTLGSDMRAVPHVFTEDGFRPIAQVMQATGMFGKPPEEELEGEGEGEGDEGDEEGEVELPPPKHKLRTF